MTLFHIEAQNQNTEISSTTQCSLKLHRNYYKLQPFFAELKLYRIKHDLAVPRADDRSYVTGSIRGWSRSHLTYIKGDC